MNHNIPPTPYFLAYPVPHTQDGRGHGKKDLEYFRQMYSPKAKYYLKTIMEILDRVDYRGSFIYDEFPDRVGLLRLVEMIVKEIRQKESKQCRYQLFYEEKDRELLELLMLYEIYLRRQDY